jgi:hypothetical protein
LIAWGSGVAKPEIIGDGRAPGHEDGFSADWGLDHVRRHDVAQADIAALMAYLAGLEFPVNSVGELPLSYLAATTEEKASAALVNVKQVLEMYKVKEEQKKATALRYKPYPYFARVNASVADQLGAIEAFIAEGHHEKAIDMSSTLLHHAIEGLRYLQTYDWLFLRLLISLGYLGWITYAITTVIDLHVLHGAVIDDRTTTSTIIFSSILVLLYASFIVDRSPLTYYAYTFFPFFFWEEVIARRKALGAGVRVLFGHIEGPSEYSSLALQIFICVAAIVAFVSRHMSLEIKPMLTSTGTIIFPPFDIDCMLYSWSILPGSIWIILLERKRLLDNGMVGRLHGLEHFHTTTGSQDGRPSVYYCWRSAHGWSWTPLPMVRARHNEQIKILQHQAISTESIITHVNGRSDRHNHIDHHRHPFERRLYPS